MFKEILYICKYMRMCIIMSKKYHKEHPTISFRCRSIDEYNRIKEMVGYAGKSESTFIREILLGAEKKESQSYINGYNKGLNKVILTCSFCNDEVMADFKNNVEAKKELAKIEKNIACEECIAKMEKQKSVV